MSRTCRARPDYDALGDASTDVDIVLDYLWGAPAEHAIRALVTRRHDRSRPLDWIQIGSVAGPDITLPSAALRAANLRIMGSGQGSVTTATIIAQLPALAAEITAGTLMVNAAPLPLSRVEAAWNASTAPGQRIVFTPEPPTVEYRHRPRRRLAAALLSHRPGAPVAPAKTASA